MSYHGKHGECRGQDSLKEIYWVAEYLLRKEEMIQRKYQEFKERKSEISEEEAIWKLERGFFEAHFPELVHVSMRESVIDILDGRKSLV